MSKNYTRALDPFTIIHLQKNWTLHRGSYLKRGSIIENAYLNCKKYSIRSIENVKIFQFKLELANKGVWGNKPFHFQHSIIPKYYLLTELTEKLEKTAKKLKFYWRMNYKIFQWTCKEVYKTFLKVFEITIITQELFSQVA